ncbi:MAG: ZIP family metal transporter, partial [Candidatus Nitrosomaritimum yanchengensis]
SVEVVMADVNDRIQPAAIEPDRFLERYETALVRIPFEWNEAEPYIIGLTIDDGTRFEREIEAAAPALKPDLEFAGFFAIIGTYVGIIPVMIGLLWLPFIKKISKSKYHFFLALTIGLLLFLGIDSIEEAIDVVDENLSGSFNGNLLIATTVILSFLGLYYTSEKLTSRVDSIRISKPAAIALMISIGIGLHNFGEGLAIGAAVGLGSIAFSTFLIVGFALHNTTEGLAIAAPLSRGKPTIGKLLGLGLIAGAPAIFGAWVGGFAFSPFSSVIFLSIGAGAIFQVIVIILKWIREEGDSNLSSAAVASGIAIGLLIMYLTSIII